MIHEFTGYTVHPEGSSYPSLMDSSREAHIEALNVLTLERNAVLIARIPRDSGYDFTDFDGIRRVLKEAFPSHTILLFYNDIDFMAINDKGVNPERITVNDSSNYY